MTSADSAEGRLQVTSGRAEMGNKDWSTANERVVTVGRAGADVVGEDNRAIQIAIDSVAHRGGGVVRVLPGEYTCYDSVRLRPNVTLLGQRDAVILRYAPLVWSPLAVDADKGQMEITPEDASNFRAGMGVSLHDSTGWLHTGQPLTITAVRDGVLHVDSYIVADRLAERRGRVVTWFPLLLGVEAHGATVDGFTVDGRVTDPEGRTSGIRTAIVYILKSRNVTVRNVAARNGVGDGICYSTASTDGLIEHCEASGNGMFGIHPGSHSTRIRVRNCDIHDNGFDGLYICWGISHSEFTDNRIWRNGWKGYRSGISIGHKDTDNLFARNHIYDNAKYGICFRQKTAANAPHRVTVRDNVIENNGSRAEEMAAIKARIEPWESIGSGIHAIGPMAGLVVESNVIRDTRTGEDRLQRHAVVLGKGVTGARIGGNSISGHPQQAIVDESGGENDITD